MDWMYKRPTVDTEAYLLGKPIDRSIELNAQLEEGCPTSNEDIGGKPGALFLEAAASAALEAEAKLREDPLYVIKKKEEEQRRMLLNNPVRLKKMQEELERQKKAEEKEEQVQQRQGHLAKMLKLKAKYGADIKDILSEDIGSSSSRSHTRESDKRRHVEGSRRRRTHSRSSSPVSRHRNTNSKASDRHRKHDRSRSRSNSPDRRQRRSSPDSSRHGSSHPKSGRSPHRRPASPKPSSQSLAKPISKTFVARKVTVPEKRKQFAATTSKFDPAELERKRREMMEDAKVRDSERASNLSSYRQKEAASEEHNKKLATGSSGGFIRPMLEKAAEGSSLEARLKLSRNKSQRTRADLDKNFSER
ncbi:hypothetical protein BV898_12185 [Hypsibius exemplaris]|uniref:Pre-mRNA-splicing factor CWC25-like protein n=1 Tax=Hypsibius exemplaris TaxID=2072580 RepID=A0A1W0WED6_HYPEX|nr:hypothetical protein BV898_12185 [Hypsibius exemplaris]